MALLRLSIVAAASPVALTLLAWLAASAPPSGDHVPCGGERLGYRVCYAGLSANGRLPRRFDRG